MGKKHEADKNFITQSANVEHYVFHSFREFTLEGFPWYEENQSFVRMPERMLDEFNDNMKEICRCPSGGLLRFCTNTKKMALFCKYHEKRESDVMSQTADAGFDLYKFKNGEYRFVRTFRVNIGEKNLDMEMVVSDDDTVYEYLLYMPVFSWVSDFNIGVEKEAQIFDTVSKEKRKKVLTYGSSVTQGACASRPGLTWPAVLTRMTGCELINMGFAGNCYGEEIIAKELAKLDFDMFIMEYGYNEPRVQGLLKRHKPFFDIIRNSHKKIPIVIISRPSFNYEHTQNDIDYRNVAYATYESAVKSGDEPVYFVDGLNIFPKEMRGDYTSPDNVHPNDRGMFEIARAVYLAAKKHFTA